MIVEVLYIATLDRNKHHLIMVSGGFDPIHVGHVRMINEAKKLFDDATLIVLVNDDQFLIDKKGYAFMPLRERMEIIDSFSNVDYVVPWKKIEDDTSMSEALKIIKPHVFANGGDRKSAIDLPEYELCQSTGIEVVFNVGGGKIQSSSELCNKL